MTSLILHYCFSGLVFQTRQGIDDIDFYRNHVMTVEVNICLDIEPGLDTLDNELLLNFSVPYFSITLHEVLLSNRSLKLEGKANRFPGPCLLPVMHRVIFLPSLDDLVECKPQYSVLAFTFYIEINILLNCYRQNSEMLKTEKLGYSLK